MATSRRESTDHAVFHPYCGLNEFLHDFKGYLDSSK
jgi:hypothetical protein